MCKHSVSSPCQQPAKHTAVPDVSSCCSSGVTCSSTTEQLDTSSPDLSSEKQTGDKETGDEEPAGSSCCNSATASTEQVDLGPNKPHQWAIANMDCPSCAGKLETALRGLTGIQSVQVVFSTEKLKVTFTDVSPADCVISSVKLKAKATGFPLSDLKAAKSAPEKPKNLLERIRSEATLLSLVAVMLLAAFLSMWSEPAAKTLFTAATLIGLLPIIKKAYNLGRSGSPFSIETLMSIAAIGALYLGETIEAAMVLVLFLIGERLEAYASSRARDGVQALMALVPENVTVLSQDGKRVTKPVSELDPGECIEVSPGERLPADGIVIDAVASFDQSALTGESVPVDIVAGDKVMAGSLAVDQVVRVKVTSRQGESAIDRILHLIEEAESKKAPVERFIDQFSRWYTPLMIIIAALVVTVPPMFFGQLWEVWVYRGLALLLIACPCALVISTPAAVTSGLATAARRGALIKGGAALEALSKVEKVAFDKTGTLTEGRPEVTDILAWQGSENDMLAKAAAVEVGSHHPLAKALVEKASSRSLSIVEASDRKTQVGKGLSGTVEGEMITIVALDKLASPLQLDESLKNQANTVASQGKTVAIVFNGTTPLGLVAWRDALRSESAGTVARLKENAISSVMLTGDNKNAAAAIAKELDIDYEAGLLPEDKVHAVEALSRNRSVAMVGDGINDAPAMKAASIGIAMGGGTDVALETADIALSHNRIEELPAVIELAQATLANVRQNVTLAVGLKAVFLVTSVLGITGLWVAVLADSGATALVTLNALRLLRFKQKSTQ